MLRSNQLSYIAKVLKTAEILVNVSVNVKKLRIFIQRFQDVPEC